MTFLESSMQNALIGHTGFVGTTLKQQTAFAALFNSSNVHEIGQSAFDTVICSAAPAQKWIANQQPEADLENLETLMSHLATLRCKQLILISTVDVFPNPVGVDERSAIQEDDLQPYGRHRRILEKFVEANFQNHLIVRLPGLIGPGLRKNAVFDLHNDNNVNAIDSRGSFQFYPMVNLYSDLRQAQQAGIRLLHLTSTPISVATIAESVFDRPFSNELSRSPVSYDFRSVHPLGSTRSPGYQYDQRDILLAMRCYRQSEPRTRSIHS